MIQELFFVCFDRNRRGSDEKILRPLIVGGGGEKYDNVYIQGEGGKGGKSYLVGKKLSRTTAKVKHLSLTWNIFLVRMVVIRKVSGDIYPNFLISKLPTSFYRFRV